MLKERLQEIFDTEKEYSKKEVVTDGKFVKIPAGAFFMGDYEDGLARLSNEEGGSRVMRGGAWGSGARFCRSAFRGSGPPDGRIGGFGFRLSRSLTLGP